MKIIWKKKLEVIKLPFQFDMLHSKRASLRTRLAGKGERFQLLTMDSYCIHGYFYPTKAKWKIQVCFS